MPETKSSNESATFEHVARWNAERSGKGWWHSFELPDGRRIDGVCSLEGLKSRLAQFPIPDNLAGKRVLDIGAWDGWFSFEMERRGAEVVAIDCWDNPRFHEMRGLLGSRVDYRLLDMYELTPECVGHFDIVLFMGVLYHLKHPLLALERVCALTTDLAAVDSFILRPEHDPAHGERPIMQYFESDEFGGQTDNWIAPNLSCLMALCRTAGFARAELRGVLDYGASIACYRKWEEAPVAGPAPVLEKAIHNGNFGINFRSHLDEYIAAYFQTSEESLTLDDVKPTVGEFGVRPLVVGKREDDTWQVNFKLPPQRRAGWHDVTLRVRNSAPSNACRIVLDTPLGPGVPRVKAVFDSVTWHKEELDLSKSNAICTWIEGLPETADAANVRATLGGRAVDTIFVEPAPEIPPGGLFCRRAHERQVNFAVPADIPPGEAILEVRVAGRGARPVRIRLLAAGR